MAIGEIVPTFGRVGATVDHHCSSPAQTAVGDANSSIRRLDILHRNAETLPTTQFADELNELLRDLIRSRTGMSTPTLTTPELIVAIDNDERFPMVLNELFATVRTAAIRTESDK